MIIKDTKFHKNIVYDNLEKLINKGVISFVIKGSKKFFRISAPEILIDLMNDKIKEFNNKKDLAIKVSEEVKKEIILKFPSNNATILKGKEGVRSYHNQVIEWEKEYLVIGAPKKSVEVMTDAFWRNFEKRRIEKNIKQELFTILL